MHASVGRRPRPAGVPTAGMSSSSVSNIRLSLVLAPVISSAMAARYLEPLEHPGVAHSATAASRWSAAAAGIPRARGD